MKRKGFFKSIADGLSRSKRESSTDFDDTDRYEDKYDEDYDDEDYDDEDYDDEYDESLDIYTAEELWIGSGKDEDYMFGYSESDFDDLD